MAFATVFLVRLRRYMHIPFSIESYSVTSDWNYITYETTDELTTVQTYGHENGGSRFHMKCT